MPTYVYENCSCHKDEAPTVEMNVPIDRRDSLWCTLCGEIFKRKIVFTGLTWAPTAGGYR